MIVYAHWPASGYHVFQAFQQENKAIDFVYHQLNKLIDAFQGDRFDEFVIDDAPLEFVGQLPIREELHIRAGQPPLKIKINKAIDHNDKELKPLRLHLEALRKSKSFDGAVLAIKLYEDYRISVLDDGALLHTLRDVKVAN